MSARWHLHVGACVSAHALDLRRDGKVGKMLSRTSGHSAPLAWIRPSRHLRTTRTFFLVHTDSLHTSQDCLFHSSFCFEEKKWGHPYFFDRPHMHNTDSPTDRHYLTNWNDLFHSGDTTSRLSLMDRKRTKRTFFCVRALSVNSPRLCFLLERCISEKVVLSIIIAD